MQQHTKPAYLIIRQGARWTDVFRMDPSRPIIAGRASSNEIPIADEKSSRRHAEFYYDNGWFVRDLGSRNGTWVDGVRITDAHALVPGQQISVASCKMQFSDCLDSVSRYSPALVPQSGEECTEQLSGQILDPSLHSARRSGESGGEGTDCRGGDPPPSITYRRSKSEILDPANLNLPIAVDGSGVSDPSKEANVNVSERSQFVPANESVPGISYHRPKDGNIYSSVRENSEDSNTPVAIQTRVFPAQALLQLAFSLAQEFDLNRGCELALERLSQNTAGCNFGILKLRIADNSAAPGNASMKGIASTKEVATTKEVGNSQAVSSTAINLRESDLEQVQKGKPQSQSQSLDGSQATWQILAVRQGANRVYQSPNEALLSRVLTDHEAILARDSRIHSGDETDSNRFDSLSLDSVKTTILAPIRLDGKCLGVIHVYNRFDEPELQPIDLEIALAMADVVGTFFGNVHQFFSLETKLASTKTRVTELEQRLAQSEQWVGKSSSLRQVQEQVAKLARSKATVLLRGESGVGKEIVARKIHETSPCADGPFVALNCAALSPTLLESELFGHEKGAFTGATERKLGKFEQAHKGTLMLDELGEMSLETQTKFLRVLEGGSFERVGGNKSIQVDVRVIAATNKDLEAAVAAGEFRSDLYFRLRIIELRIPPLRERVEDILLIAEHYLQLFRQRSGHGPVAFSPRAVQAMQSYSWPGNIRELRNAVERAHVLGSGQLAEPEDLALSHLSLPGVPSFNADVDSAVQSTTYVERTLDQVESLHIEATLKYTGGQKNRAAAILGIERSTLDRKLKKMKNEA